MDVNKLFGSAIGELEKMLKTKTAVGDPITVGETTIIPLTSVGFAFGAGGGSGSGKAGEGSGTGGATGGGGGVRPVAVLVIDSNGVRVETLNTATSLVSKVADTITEVVKTTTENRRLNKEAEERRTLPQSEARKVEPEAKRIAVESDND